MYHLRAFSLITHHKWLPASCQPRGSTVTARCSQAGDVPSAQRSTPEPGARKRRRKEEQAPDISTMTPQQLQRLTKAQLIQHLQKEVQEKQALLAAAQASPSAAQQQPVPDPVPTGKPEKYKLWHGLAIPVNPEQKAKFGKLEKKYRHWREKEDEDNGEQTEEDQELDEWDDFDEDFDGDYNYIPGQELSKKWEVAFYPLASAMMGPDWVMHMHIISYEMGWDASKQQITYGGRDARFGCIISPAMYLYRLVCLFPKLDVRVWGYESPRSTWLAVLRHKKTGAFVMCSEEEASVNMAILYPPSMSFTDAKKKQIASDVLELANVICRPNLRHPWSFRADSVAGSLSPYH